MAEVQLESAAVVVEGRRSCLARKEGGGKAVKGEKDNL